jgi:hypothetical protein
MNELLGTVITSSPRNWIACNKNLQHPASGLGSHGELLTRCPNHSLNHRGTWLTLAWMCGRGPLFGLETRSSFALEKRISRSLSSTHMSAKALLKQMPPAPARTLVCTTEARAECQQLRPVFSEGAGPWNVDTPWLLL